MKLFKTLRKKEEKVVKNESGLGRFEGNVIDVDFEEITTIPNLVDIS